MNCLLLKQHSAEKGEWLEHKKQFQVTVAKSGIYLVEIDEPSKIVMNFEMSSISRVEFLENRINKIATDESTPVFAIKFLSDAANLQFRTNVEAFAIPHNYNASSFAAMDTKFHFPDLSDPDVQEFVSSLLYTDGFQDFVSEIKKMIDK